MNQPLLEIDDLAVAMVSNSQLGDHSRHVLDSIYISINPGESVGLIGESGAGKTMLSRAIFRVLPETGARIVKGGIYFRGRNLLNTPPAAFRDLLGTRISLLFQEPSMALDPVFTIGDQMVETVMAHAELNADEALGLVKDWLRRVGLAEPDRVITSYPFELSGGMLQRSALAQSLLLRPELLVADEPTTALDASLKVVVLELLDRLRTELNMSLLLVSHDLAAVAWCCERTLVIISGVLVEEGPTRKILTDPVHPYTRELLANGQRKTGPVRPYHPVPVQSGTCPFIPRCGKSVEACRKDIPPWKVLSPNHRVRCYATNS
ncbi:MAG: ABC transporter ATP-binding protein [bacterium]|nr:ABC transporter ATP-binding protein [bacterium]